MTTLTRPDASAARSRTHLRRLGLLTVVAGLLGAASAAVLLLWPAQVPATRYSHPFDAATYTAVQSFFAVQHFGILTGIYAVTVLAWSGASRWTRAGLVVGMAGLVGLAGCELLAIVAAHALVGSARANLVDDSYGAPILLIGIGLTLAGIGLTRRPVLPEWGRWIVLALGCYVFVPLFPAVFRPDAVGRIAIGGWMLLFGALGLSLLRAGRGPR